MTTTIDRLGTQAGEVSKDVQKMGGIVADAAEEKFTQVRSAATEYYDQGQAKAHDIVCVVEQFVRRQPFTTVLVAAGVGWLFGRLWKRG